MYMRNLTLGEGKKTLDVKHLACGSFLPSGRTSYYQKVTFKNYTRVIYITVMSKLPQVHVIAPYGL